MVNGVQYLNMHNAIMGLEGNCNMLQELLEGWVNGGGQARCHVRRPEMSGAGSPDILIGKIVWTNNVAVGTMNHR